MRSMARFLRITGVLATAAFAFFAVAAPAVFALDPSTPVSSDGTEVVFDPAAEGLKSAAPFRGSGLMTAEMAAAQDGLGLSYAEIEALKPATGGVGIASAIGFDTRVRTTTFGSPGTQNYPARATALVTFTGGYCTGFFIGPNTVATAGHCVHSGGTTGAWRTNVRVYPGYNAGSAPYGSYAARRLYSVTGWTSSKSELYDYGAIKLSVGTSVGYYGFFWTSASLTGSTAIVLGYPGDKSPAQSQWTGSDEVNYTGTQQVFYRTDTYGGQSGSPVWFDRPSGTTTSVGPYAYAIHAYGIHGAYPHTINHGTRITQSVYNNLIAWRNAAP